MTYQYLTLSFLEAVGDFFHTLFWLFPKDWSSYVISPVLLVVA
jgi:hypothetical protein